MSRIRRSRPEARPSAAAPGYIPADPASLGVELDPALTEIRTGLAGHRRRLWLRRSVRRAWYCRRGRRRGRAPARDRPAAAPHRTGAARRSRDPRGGHPGAPRPRRAGTPDARRDGPGRRLRGRRGRCGGVCTGLRECDAGDRRAFCGRRRRHDRGGRHVRHRPRRRRASCAASVATRRPACGPWILACSAPGSRDGRPLPRSSRPPWCCPRSCCRTRWTWSSRRTARSARRRSARRSASTRSPRTSRARVPGPETPAPTWPRSCGRSPSGSETTPATWTGTSPSWARSRTRSAPSWTRPTSRRLPPSRPCRGLSRGPPPATRRPTRAATRRRRGRISATRATRWTT